ncbi:DUF4328 domain-containing protein [Streptomyces paromomycinus]|uniref:DUF4328 domain-containing protein n=1 Tax=Streptomyces paromomycinus TaxID=92743 RepID=A0A401W691_STREY|nr:DUF4328 domain-containing protein [Streptomyces paromomycinus]GCD44781.1 hypothetical protein GKJPGBOP_04495 [Streptomyces paromomycinus]
MSHIPVGPPPPGFPPPDGFPPTGGPALRPTWGLAKALTVLFCLVIATGLFALFKDVHAFALLDDLTVLTEQDAEHADALEALSSGLQSTALLATGIVFLIWFYRSRVNAEHCTRDVCTLGRGWAIGAWFIPVANLWLPFRVARETWQASTQPAPDGAWRTVSTAPVRTWWALWVLTEVIDYIGIALFGIDVTAFPDTSRQVVVFTALTDLLNVVSAVPAALFVRKLTRMQQVPAAPYAVAATGPVPYGSA